MPTVATTPATIPAVALLFALASVCNAETLVVVTVVDGIVSKDTG